MKQNLVCLLVDDDQDDREIFNEALSEVSPETQCHSVRDGAEAIQVLSNGLTPDCIFLDINMPRMNGFEFLREIKRDERLKNIPVIVHSTSAKPKEMETMMKMGAFGIHLKAYTFRDVCDMIRKYLNVLYYYL